jgi:hypothetical protein
MVNHKDKTKVHDPKRKYRKLIFTLGVIMFACIVSAWMLAHCFVNKPETVPLQSEQMKSVTSAVIDPQGMTESEHTGAVQVLDNIAANLKAIAIRTATRQSINVLRGNFKGLKTIEQKKAKVHQIMEDIDRHYVFNNTTQKLFNKEFISAGMEVYMNEVSAEERTLYDPIVHAFIRKMNTIKK